MVDITKYNFLFFKTCSVIKIAKIETHNKLFLKDLFRMVLVK